MKKIETGIWQMDDGRYRVRTTALSPATGVMVQREATVDSLPEARRIKDALKEEIRSELPTGSAAPIITLADYAERWVAERGKRLKPSTLSGYMLALTRWILPRIGHLRIQSVVRADIEGWVAWAQAQRKPPAEVVHIQRRVDRGWLDETEGAAMIAEVWARTDKDSLDLYSTDSLRAHWRVMVTMLRDGVADGHIPIDPTVRVYPPDTGVRRRREHGTLSADELGRLIEEVRHHHPARYAEVVTLAFTGMRSGEMYALRWDDISPDRIVVSRSVWRGTVGKTKTGATREVPMTEVVSSALEDHRRELIRRQHPGLDLGLVFPADGGGYRVQSSITKPLMECAESAGISQRVSPQVFRRTFNTLMALAGVDRLALRSMLGHVEEEMTERYAGVRLDQKVAAVARLVTMTCDPGR